MLDDEGWEKLQRSIEKLNYCCKKEYLEDALGHVVDLFHLLRNIKGYEKMTDQEVLAKWKLK